ncbi:MAG: asparagine synthase (glutamine-hydrolyzing) [Gemmataceae bacterium]
MCGIAGIIGQPIGTDLSVLAQSFLRRLAHRGPDDQGWLTLSKNKIRRGRGPLPSEDPEVLLLHLRLSILDRSESGWQPMTTADGRYSITFNGEIYNYLELRAELIKLGHEFQSQSDTEVLLHAFSEWGPACLPRLVGMFAFALLDSLDRRLFLVRDFFGIKPLYYINRPRLFAFASEIKALLELQGIGRAANPHRVFDYLRWGRTDHGNETLFAEIKQVPAAHFVELSLDGVDRFRLQRFWRLDAREPIVLSFKEAASKLRDLFLESIRLHLRSDVPVGAALSGGIDSSAIVAAMRLIEPNLDLHTIGYVADDPALSEERWVDLAGSHGRAIVHKVKARPEEMISDLDRLIAQQDEPFGSTSIYAQYRVFRQAQDSGITVMLDGQGADEMLAGYRPFLSSRIASLISQGQWAEAGRFLGNASRLMGGWATTRFLMEGASYLAPSQLQGFARRIAGKGIMPAWLDGDWFRNHGVSFGSSSFYSSSNKVEVLREHLRQSVEETSLPMLLRYEDRNSMAHSIESRVPFLTPSIAEFALGLPEEYLLAPNGTSKSVFRLAMRGIVPDAILDRNDKIGFATPERSWLSALRPWVLRTLTSETARRISPINVPAMLHEWQGILERNKHFDFRIWRWVNFVKWAENNQVTFDHGSALPMSSNRPTSIGFCSGLPLSA